MLESPVLQSLFTWKAAILYAFLASALFVHFRGQVRIKFYRQVTDHSTFMVPINALMYFFSAVPNRPFIDVKQFPDLQPLTDNWQTLRDEALKLFDDGYIRAAAGYTDLGFNSFFRRGWKRFYVKWYDKPLPSALALCPKTVALVQSIPSINGAMFALLPPGGKLGKHRDPFAGSLRYHLGLQTPNSADCHIFVDGQQYFWKDGEAVMFDETFIHWAENKSDVMRVILFCDIERPLTSRAMTRINHWYKNTLIRASQTENIPGDHIGWLNRIFSVVYYLREPGKALKHHFRPVYYTLKWLILIGLVYWIFFMRSPG
ncbi:MAG: aspartyl/asparaginyl beta-hydroxylase domain-containing protein [Betaproteobacteria bacterium]